MIDEHQPTAGLTYQGRPRTYGLRFSVLDGLVLAGALAMTIATWNVTGGLSLLLLFVVLHFFLFCNVFRIRRKPELIWAGTFLFNCGVWILTGHANLLGIAISQLLVTVVILGHEVRKPYYHGIFARSLNPRLDDYLADRLGE